MSDTWETVGMSDVGPGDRVRYHDYEFTIARVDSRSSAWTRWCA